MILFIGNFLKVLKRTVAVTLFITCSVSAMSESEKERLKREHSSLQAILKMGGLVEEERKSAEQKIQDLENELQIRKIPTPASLSSAPASSLASSYCFVEEELKRLRAKKSEGIEDDRVNNGIKLLEAAQREGIKKYITLKRLRRLVILSSKDPSSIPDVF